MCTTLKTRGKLSHMLKQGKPKTVNPSKRGFVINVKSREQQQNRSPSPRPGIQSTHGYPRQEIPREEKLTYEARNPISFTRRWDVSKGKEDRCSRSPTGRFITTLAGRGGGWRAYFRPGEIWKDVEGTWKKKKEEEGKKADHPPLRDFSRYHLSLSLSPFEFLKRRRHRCLLDNSVRHARMTGRRQTRRDGSTSERCILEYAHVQVVLLVHIRLIDGASKSRVQPRATRVGDSSKRNLVSF